MRTLTVRPRIVHLAIAVTALASALDPGAARARVVAPDLAAGVLDRVAVGATGGCDETRPPVPGFDRDALADGAPSLGRPGLAELCGAEDVDPASLVLAGSAVPEDPLPECGGHSDEPYDVPEALFEEAHRMPTPRGQAIHVPLRGLDGGSHARVHWEGDVAAVDRDGAVRWSVGARELHEAWDLHLRGVPYVLTGVSPSDPFSTASDQPMGAGDLTGDGVDDVAVAHWARFGCLPDVSFIPHVTVFDGRDGETLWAERLEGTATQVRVLGGLLLVGEQSGGAADARVRALALASENGAWAAEEVWRLDTGATPGAILDVEPAGDGRVAVAWTGAPLGGGAPMRGTVTLLDLATGAASWSVPTAGYPRTLRADGPGGALVVHTHTDPGQAYDATIARLDLATGTETASRTAADTILLDLALADLGPRPGVEVIAAEVRLAPSEAYDDEIGEGRVTAHDAGLEPLWTGTWGAPAVGYPYRLVATEGAVAVGVYEHPVVENVYTPGLYGLDGLTGAQVWGSSQGIPFPAWITAGERDGETVAVGSTSTQRFLVREVALPNVAVDRGGPGHAYGLEVADVSGDGVADLLIGYESGAVVAADGTDLDGVPTPLWERDLTFPVHELRLADLDGTGGPELVAVAEEQVAVLDAASGEVRYELPFPGELIWTASIGDVDGDGLDDVVVPSRTMTAWRGADGSSLWTYAPLPDVGDLHFGTPAIGPDGTVVAQLVYQAPTRPVNHGIGKMTLGHVALVHAVDGATGELRWTAEEAEPGLKARQWRSAAYGDVDGTGRQGYLLAYQGAPGAVPNTWRVRLVALDPDTGAYLARDTSQTQSIPTGIAESSGRLVAMSWWGLKRFDGAESVEVMMGQVRQMGVADLGGWGRLHLATDTRSIRAYRDDPATWIPDQQPRPQVVLAHGGERETWNGAFDVADLEGDGVDEIVTHLFDYRAYLTLDYYEAIVSVHVDIQPYGVSVLRAPGT